jgi:hypothetical protein
VPLRFRAALALLVVAAAAALAVAPRPLSTPIRKLANYRADTRDPIYNAAVDGGALRRAGAILPDSSSTTYYIQTRPAPQLGHDLIGATLLFFLPARPVPSPREARWVFSYQAPSLLPRGVRALHTYDLGNRVYLVRVRPA